MVWKMLKIDTKTHYCGYSDDQSHLSLRCFNAMCRTLLNNAHCFKL